MSIDLELTTVPSLVRRIYPTAFRTLGGDPSLENAGWEEVSNTFSSIGVLRAHPPRSSTRPVSST